MQEMLPLKLLAELVKETGAEDYTKKFTVLRQLNVMMYAHLKEKSSLGAITSGLKAEKKLQEYTDTISGSQLSRANRERSPELFRAVFEAMFNKVSQHGGLRKIPLSYGYLKVLDSTAVQLCLKLFPWAKYRDKTGAVKIHTLYDVILGCPEKILLTDGLTHDKKKMSEFVTEPGVTYLFDRAYLDHKEYDKYCDDGIFFVSRLKKNAVFEVKKVNPVKRRKRGFIG